MVCPNEGWLPEVLRAAEISVEIRGMRGAEWYRTLGYLRRRVRKGKIDAIHTHLTRAAYLGCSAGWLSGAPIVTSVHIANNDPIYKRLARGRNRIVAVSDYVRGMLHGLGVSERHIDTVYNGTDFGELAPNLGSDVHEELGIPPERRLIGLVGKVCREKGHLEMIEAMRAVRRRHPNTHAVFVGKIEEAFEPEVREAISRSGMQEHLTLTGLRHDVPRLMDSFTMAAVPSHMETFGVAAIEAMARGKAVVATRVGGLMEVVRHRQTGLLVDLRAEELAGAVSYLLENESEREQMGAMGRLLVEQKFTLQEMTDRFEQVYRQTLKTRG